jgi:hypothetical protein
VSLVHTGQGPLPVKARRFVDFGVPQLRKVLEKLTKKNPPGLAKAGSSRGPMREEEAAVDDPVATKFMRGWLEG